MTLVRILVDGHNLLKAWKDVAPEHSRDSETAREELLHRLTLFNDATGTPITVVFQGDEETSDVGPGDGATEVELLYHRQGQQAHQVIQREARRISGQGAFLVVTDEIAGQDTVQELGGTVSSCRHFIKTAEEALAELKRQIEQFNQQENQKFSQHG